MAELFAETGQSEDVAVAAPNLQGVFLPAIDNPDMQDGFGLRTPFGGGPTQRSYLKYGIPDESNYNTLLSDLSNSLLAPAGGGAFNFEGLVGPQGIPGRDGLPGITTVIGLPAVNSNFLTALPDNLDQINDLGTAADKMIYTSGYLDVGGEITWAERQPIDDDDYSWLGIATDADGSNLIVCQGDPGRIYTSADSGATWTERRPIDDNDYYWGSVESDSDGSHLFAADFFTNAGKLYTSYNSGVTWFDITPVFETPFSYIVASDSDGSNLIAIQDQRRVWTSINEGINWTERRPLGDVDSKWSNVASDSDGTNLGVTNDDSTDGGIFISTNSGVIWNDKTPGGVATNVWTDIASDSDGSNLIALVNLAGGLGEVYISSDYGENWSSVQPVEGSDIRWTRVASDSTGQNLVVATYNGRVYSSDDSGVTWSEQQIAGDSNEKWWDVAISGDGAKMAAVSGSSSLNNGRVYTSEKGEASYSLATWAETTITEVARSLMDDTTQGAQQTTLGLGTGDSPTFTGLTLTAISAEATDVDKFLVDSTGVIKYRTGDQLLSDIGASSSAHLHNTQILEHDGVNSDGGAFAFNTTGDITFNNNLIIPNGGYIGSASDSDAIQIEEDGDIVISQGLIIAGAGGLVLKDGEDKIYLSANEDIFYIEAK